MDPNAEERDVVQSPKAERDEFIPPHPSSGLKNGTSILVDARSDQGQGFRARPTSRRRSSLPQDYLADRSDTPSLVQQTVPKGDLRALFDAVPIDDMVRRDEAMVEGQKRQLDTLLVFAGLLSAALTAFNIEVYPMLLPGPNANTTVTVLMQISAQLASFSANGPYINSTQPSLSSAEAASTEIPPIWQITINLLWSISLILSFSAASVAIVVKQWLDQYSIGLTDESHSSKLIRLRRYKGFIYFKVDWIIMLVPLMLQASLVLFLAGLLQLLWTLHPIIAILGTTLAAILFSFLVYTTILPSFVKDCPFRSPQSHIFLQGIRKLKSALFPPAPKIQFPLRSSVPLSRVPTFMSPGPMPPFPTQSPYIKRIIAAGGHYTWEEEERSYLSNTSDKDAALIIDRLLDNAVESRHAITHLSTILEKLHPVQAIHCFLPLARKYAKTSQASPYVTELAMDTVARIANSDLEVDLTYHEPLRQALALVRQNLPFVIMSKTATLVEDAAKIACTEGPAAPLAFDLAVDLLHSFDITEISLDGLQCLWTSLRTSFSVPRKRLASRKLQLEYAVLLLYRLVCCLDYLRQTDSTDDADKLSKLWCSELPDVLWGILKLYTRFSRPFRLPIPQEIKHSIFGQKFTTAMQRVAFGEDWPAFCRLKVDTEVPQPVRVVKAVVQLLAALHSSATWEPMSWHTLIQAVKNFVSDIYEKAGFPPDIDLAVLLNSFLAPPESATDQDTAVEGDPSFTPVMSVGGVGPMPSPLQAGSVPVYNAAGPGTMSFTPVMSIDGLGSMPPLLQFAGSVPGMVVPGTTSFSNDQHGTWRTQSPASGSMRPSYASPPRRRARAPSLQSWPRSVSPTSTLRTIEDDTRPSSSNTQAVTHPTQRLQTGPLARSRQDTGNSGRDSSTPSVAAEAVPASRSGRAHNTAPEMLTPSVPLSDFPLPQRQASPKLAQNTWTTVHLDPRRTPSPVEGHAPVHARPPQAHGKSVNRDNSLQPGPPRVRPPSSNGYQNGPPLEYMDAYTPPGGPSRREEPYRSSPSLGSSETLGALSSRSATTQSSSSASRSYTPAVTPRSPNSLLFPDEDPDNPVRLGQPSLAYQKDPKDPALPDRTNGGLEMSITIIPPSRSSSPLSSHDPNDHIRSPTDIESRDTSVSRENGSPPNRRISPRPARKNVRWAFPLLSMDSEIPIVPAPDLTAPPLTHADSGFAESGQSLASPSHPPVEIPPDNWIPYTDRDLRIRLPPPHELVLSPQAPSPPASVVLPSTASGMEIKPVAVSLPADHGDTPMSNTDSIASGQVRHRLRRSRSSESQSTTRSQSTTMSQFEILKPPRQASTPVAPISASSYQQLPSVLSAIAEERERASFVSPPTGTGKAYQSPPYAQSTTSTFYRPQEASSQLSFTSGAAPSLAQVYTPDYSRPPPSPASSSESSLQIHVPPSPGGSCNSLTQSLNSGWEISIEPPSRPDSPHPGNVSMTSNLSANGPDCPLPAVQEDTPTEPQGPAIPNFPPQQSQTTRNTPPEDFPDNIVISESEHARPPHAHGKSVSGNNPLQPSAPRVRPPSASGYQNGPPLEYYVDASTPPGGPSQQPYYRNPGRSSPPMSARLSTPRVPNAHHRSVNMGGGGTPTFMQAAGAEIRRVPSTGSISSARSGHSDYKPYDSSTYVDPAYYASRDNLAMNPDMVPNEKFGGASPALSSRSLRD